MENYELEHSKFFKPNSSSLAYSNYQNSNAKNEFITFSDRNSTTKGLSIETLMTETPIVGTEMKQFASRDDSKWIVHFGIFGLSEFCSKEHNNWLVNRIRLHKCNSFDSDLDERNEACGYGEFWV